MKRVTINPRASWQDRAEEYGFDFHHVDGELYWDESLCYTFSLQEVEQNIEDPTQELAEMCLDLVAEAVRDEELLRKLAIAEKFWPLVQDSWQRGEQSLYGRFDFAYDGVGPAKLYEYNADTPTALYEAAFFQWLWLEDAREQGIVPPQADQFNLIQEELIATFGNLPSPDLIHFCCVKGSQEDLSTIAYLQDCAAQAGLAHSQVFIEDIGADSNGHFVDQNNIPIRWLFKLYPWEFMLQEDYAAHLAHCDTNFIEPPWKMLLSNKGILPLLWERHPKHPNLLPAWFHDPQKQAALPDYVLKPLFSREGANIRAFRNHTQVLATPGNYGAEGFVGQALCAPPNFASNAPIIGSWVVGGKACGMGIREDNSPITGNLSRFVPHIILD